MPCVSLQKTDCLIRLVKKSIFTTKLLFTGGMFSCFVNCLGALLRTLCDPVNRRGEIGYYLASFEAAISHIREMDLTETRDEMFSFLSIPLEDSFD